MNAFFRARLFFVPESHAAASERCAFGRLCEFLIGPVTSRRARAATMSEVTRAGWFDNARNQAVTEQIVKEDRYRNAAMATDLAAELAELEAEEKAREEAIAAELARTRRPGKAGGSEHGDASASGSAGDGGVDPATLTQWQRDNAMANEIGRSLWKNGNARYDPSTMNTRAHYKTDFVWDEDEVEPPDKRFFRKRDNFTAYVEAAARRNIK